LQTSFPAKLARLTRDRQALPPFHTVSHRFSRVKAQPPATRPFPDCQLSKGATPRQTARRTTLKPGPCFSTRFALPPGLPLPWGRAGEEIC
jgi:hypothetical protein